MHCSSCEPLLDRYLECTLPPRKMAEISAHIQTCASCRELLDEVKVVDALLFTTRVPDLPENFTFAVMAEVNGMPAVSAPRQRVWSFLAIYSAAAWVAAVLAILLTGTPLAKVTAAMSKGFSATGEAIAGVLHTAPQPSPELAAFGFGMLAVDALLAAGLILLYFTLRPRLAAAFAASQRSSHD